MRMASGVTVLMAGEGMSTLAIFSTSLLSSSGCSLRLPRSFFSFLPGLKFEEECSGLYLDSKFISSLELADSSLIGSLASPSLSLRNSGKLPYFSYSVFRFFCRRLLSSSSDMLSKNRSEKSLFFAGYSLS